MVIRLFSVAGLFDKCPIEMLQKIFLIEFATISRNRCQLFIRAFMQNTKKIINDILSGDTEAFRQIIAENQRLVYHIVFRLVENVSDREDLCQDIFIKIYQNLSGFKFDSKLSTWIGRIAYNATINHLKKKKTPLYDDQCRESESVETVPAEQTLPDQLLTSNDLHHHLMVEIKKLPQNYATILTLFHLEEMSYLEIAEIMNLPEGTVKSYLFRARKCLKDNLVTKFKQEELWKANI